LFDILNYIPTNEKVVGLVYDYRGVCSRSILIQAISIIWNVVSIETLANEVKIIVSTSVEDITQIVESDEEHAPVVYNNINLTSLEFGNSAISSVISFIKLFLPIGVLLNISFSVEGEING
jgi:hypothetical protein